MLVGENLGGIEATAGTAVLLAGAFVVAVMRDHLERAATLRQELVEVI